MTSTYTKLRRKKIALSDADFQAEFVQARDCMFMYLTTINATFERARRERWDADEAIIRAGREGETQTIYVARQRGFAVGAANYITERHLG